MYSECRVHLHRGDSNSCSDQMVSKPDDNGSLGRLLYTKIIFVRLLIAIEDEQQKLGRKVCCIGDVVKKKLAFSPFCGELQIFCELREFLGGQGEGGKVIL